MHIIDDKIAQEVYISKDVWRSVAKLRHFFMHLKRPFFCVSGCAYDWFSVPGYLNDQFNIECTRGTRKDFNQVIRSRINIPGSRAWDDAHFYTVQKNPYEKSKEELKRVKTIRANTQRFKIEDLIV